MAKHGKQHMMTEKKMDTMMREKKKGMEAMMRERRRRMKEMERSEHAA